MHSLAPVCLGISGRPQCDGDLGWGQRFAYTGVGGASVPASGRWGRPALRFRRFRFFLRGRVRRPGRAGGGGGGACLVRSASFVLVLFASFVACFLGCFGLYSLCVFVVVPRFWGFSLGGVLWSLAPVVARFLLSSALLLASLSVPAVFPAVILARPFVLAVVSAPRVLPLRRRLRLRPLGCRLLSSGFLAPGRCRRAGCRWFRVWCAVPLLPVSLLRLAAAWGLTRSFCLPPWSVVLRPVSLCWLRSVRAALVRARRRRCRVCCRLLLGARRWAGGLVAARRCRWWVGWRAVRLRWCGFPVAGLGRRSWALSVRLALVALSPVGLPVRSLALALVRGRRWRWLPARAGLCLRFGAPLARLLCPRGPVGRGCRLALVGCLGAGRGCRSPVLRCFSPPVGFLSPWPFGWGFFCSRLPPW